MSNPGASGPPGWGEDELTAYFDGARQNAYASFHNLKAKYGVIAAVDRGFLMLLEGFTDPENPDVAALAYRAHAAFRAAAQLALSGQLPESYAIMRGCLEHTLYAHYMDAMPDALAIWRARDEGEAERKTCQREFNGRHLFDALAERDAGLRERAKALYERAIDLGAHPNEPAVSASVSVTEAEDAVHFDVSYVAPYGLSMKLALRSLPQTGLIALDILCLIFPAQCAATGLPAYLAPIKARF